MRISVLCPVVFSSSMLVCVNEKKEEEEEEIENLNRPQTILEKEKEYSILLSTIVRQLEV